ncbi:hypothetical protein [Micrococcus terreus]|uniref:hypothetical protein n=1 Tax=Micrococcus terreus TaxID=574650 RepID=UPI003D71721E
MTDIMFTRTALTEAAETAGVTTDQARTILEAAGVDLAPEPPAPGQWFQAVEHGTDLPVWGIQSKNSPRVTLIFEDGTSRTEDGLSVGNLRNITPARLIPEGELEALADAQDTLEDLAKMGVTEDGRGAVLEMAARLAVHGIDSDEVDRMVKQHYSTTATTPVTLTEDQVGEAWNANKVPHLNRWTATLGSLRGSITATANALLAQHAAPAEGEPIDVTDVREGDRVRVELENGDEATFTVTRVAPDFLTSERYVFYAREIRSVRLLHREEA